MNSKILCAWKRFSVVCSDHQLPDGTVVEQVILQHPGAVIILPVTADNKLVMVNQYRPSIGRWILEFPAGTLEENENIQDCAARELAEEVQLQASLWRPLGEFIAAPGFCDEVIYGFVANNLTETMGQTDEDEVIEVKILSVAEFEAGIINGQICDSKTLALFARARLAAII